MRKRDRMVGRRESGWFARFPVVVLQSTSYRKLSFKSRALLLDLGSQFNGHNNGDLCATWSLMRKLGWRSKDTLQRALAELKEAGMIELTRQGGLHQSSLYAYTWMPIDHCGGKLDVVETSVASNIWRKAPLLEKRLPPRRAVQCAPTTVADCEVFDPTAGALCPDERV
jgi:hypothetical protein